MAKSAAGRTGRRVPLTGTVSVTGSRPRVTLGQRAAAVADLGIVLTGGTSGARQVATFTVRLNAPTGGTGTARLEHDGGRMRVLRATKTANAYVFESVPFPEPGPNARRTIRITNVRANASQVGVSATPIPSSIVASVTVSGAGRVRLANSEQALATLVRPGARPRARNGARTR